jgi:endoglucanase
MSATAPRDTHEDLTIPPPPRRKRRRPLGSVLAIAGLLTAGAVVVVVVLLLGDDGGHARPSAREAAGAFLSRYVEPDGRVSRVDQGGDTVSEGQAYGMLLAVVDEDPATFAKVWTWTRDNLRQPDGLLAWHWEDGKVVAPDSAADADLDAAWALLLASQRFDSGTSRGEAAGYRGEALALANAILEGETVSLDGRSLLVAGDWANSFPAVVDPSYFTPAAFGALGKASGDPRWKQLGETSREVLGQLTQRSTGLAPDWALVDSDGKARPTAPPGAEGEAVFGYDAVRVPLWQATGCDGRDTPYAARMAHFFDETVTREPAATYSLEGKPLGGSPGAPLLIAAAAASAAAGEARAGEEWLTGAEADVEGEPTYYGAALLALGRATLDPEGSLSC